MTPLKHKVSVIVPIYNTERYLEETIKSCINQSLKGLEIILVNDGSTDYSSKICQKYSEEFNHIVFISIQNSGVSVARNIGLENASGEYIFFMDSDDTIDSTFLETSYEIAKEANSDLVILGKDYCKRMPNAPAFPTCAMMIRNEFLKANKNLRFPKGIQPCEDGLLSHQILASTLKISENPYAVYNYRHHELQNHKKINSDSWRVLHQIPEWLEILENFYQRKNLFTSHSLHLAKFLEHEPFELRYLAMSLNKEQKTFLHSIIRKFYLKNIKPYINKKDIKKLSPPFLMFINSIEYGNFDKYYPKYLKRQGRKKKSFLFLIKLIPISSIRRNLRTRIRENM